MGRMSLWMAAVLTMAGAALAANGPAANGGGAATAPATRPANGLAAYFRKNVTVDVTPQFLIIHSDGIPDHTTGDFPNARNPNRILKQHYAFKIPLKPTPADHVTKLPMGPIGVAINGVPFYNPYNAEGQDAAKNEVFDECCGHPDPQGRYHYHIYPKCIHTSFSDPAGEHSPLIGFAFDGYAIYGPNGDGGTPPTDLDECNGHTDAVRGYHYHVTNKFPYILGGYHGVVEASNLDGGGRGGPGGRGPEGRGPGGRGGPPPGGRGRGMGGMGPPPGRGE
jgi:hypothetical protein